MDFKQYKAIFIVLAALLVFVLPVSADITGVTVAVTPASAYKTSTLDCGFTVSGNMSTYKVNVTWLKNSAAYASDNENAIVALDDTLTHSSAVGDIESADLTKGDSWQCRAIAYDTERDSMTVTSNAVAIQNSAPVITSNADTTAQTLQDYTYSVTATDADGDELTYVLETAPANMSISDTGMITWTPSESQSGSYSVIVEVTDGTAITRQSYTVSVSRDKLAIEKLSSKCTPDKCDDNLNENSGGSIDEVAPGSTIKVTVRAENLWPDGTDNHEIRNIEVVGTLDEMGDSDEQEESSDFKDIDPGEKTETVTLEYKVPEAVDEDTYNLELVLSGEDEDGTDYEISYDIDVVVEKQNHLMWIKKATAMPNMISCSRNIEISATVKNIGSNDEDGAELTLINKDLGISKSEFFDLQSGDFDDEDTEWSKDFSFQIADSVAPGTYDIEVKAYYESGGDYERTTIPITVQKCETGTGSGSTSGSTTGTGSTSGSVTTPPKDTDKVEVVTAPSTQVKVPVAAKPVSTESFLDSDAFLILLVAAIVVLLIVCVVMIFALARK